MPIDKFGRQLKSFHGVQGKPGIGFQLTSEGDFDIANKRLVNIANPLNDNDACTKKYIDDIIEFLKTAIENFYEKFSSIDVKLGKIQKYLLDNVEMKKIN